MPSRVVRNNSPYERECAGCGRMMIAWGIHDCLGRDPVREVYNKYKHLDHLLSDKDWIDGADFRYQILHELWLAIKGRIEEEDGS